MSCFDVNSRSVAALLHPLLWSVPPRTPQGRENTLTSEDMFSVIRIPGAMRSKTAFALRIELVEGAAQGVRFRHIPVRALRYRRPPRTPPSSMLLRVAAARPQRSSRKPRGCPSNIELGGCGGQGPSEIERHSTGCVPFRPLDTASKTIVASRAKTLKKWSISLCSERPLH